MIYRLDAADERLWRDGFDSAVRELAEAMQQAGFLLDIGRLNQIRNTLYKRSNELWSEMKNENDSMQALRQEDSVHKDSP